MTARALRALALLLAVAAVIDPGWPVSTPQRPIVEMSVAPGAETLAAMVAEELAPRFDVAEAPLAGASARLVVGDAATLPNGDGVPAFAVVADDRVVITVLDVPTRASLRSRVPVEVSLRADTAVDVELWIDGLMADRATARRSGDGTMRASMSFAPARIAAHELRVLARPSSGDTVLDVSGVSGARGPDARADTLVSITDERWSVLVHDLRPSWASTFIRRVLDRDERFDVATRVNTSPRAVVTQGSIPVSLADAADLAGFDVVIVGAPELLGDAEVEALGEFMRLRGGSVIMLIDERPGGIAVWAPTDGWDERLSQAPLDLLSDDGEPELRASELLTPRVLPPGATVLVGTATDEGGTPVIWRVPLGAGRLIVSGALDAWRFRAVTDGRHDEFWRHTIAAAAAAAPAPLSLRVDRRVGRPGDLVAFDVAVRDLVAAGASAPSTLLGARLEKNDESVSVRLWPGAPGRFHGALRFPATEGVYVLVIEDAAGNRVDAAVAVGADVVAAAAVRPAVVEAWTAGNGGVVVSAARLAELGPAIAAATTPTVMLAVRYPMRSPWWIVPFALLLGGEWWLRRRRGDR